jgi:hypothetical protein
MVDAKFYCLRAREVLTQHPTHGVEGSGIAVGSSTPRLNLRYNVKSVAERVHHDLCMVDSDCAMSNSHCLHAITPLPEAIHKLTVLHRNHAGLTDKSATVLYQGTLSSLSNAIEFSEYILKDIWINSLKPFLPQFAMNFLIVVLPSTIELYLTLTLKVHFLLVQSIITPFSLIIRFRDR